MKIERLPIINGVLVFRWSACRGVNVKTRKRNIVVPEDPASFADAIIALVTDAAEGASLDADLEAATKALDGAELEWSRYGDVLFEVWFAGGRVSTGANLQDESAPKLTTTVGRGAERGGVGQTHASAG